MKNSEVGQYLEILKRISIKNTGTDIMEERYFQREVGTAH
jgi:hypothetical protein